MKPNRQTMTELNKALVFALRAVSDQIGREPIKLEMRRGEVRAPMAELTITFSPTIDDAATHEQALKALKAIVEDFELTNDVQLGRIALQWVPEAKQYVLTDGTFLDGR